MEGIVQRFQVDESITQRLTTFLSKLHSTLGNLSHEREHDSDFDKVFEKMVSKKKHRLSSGLNLKKPSFLEEVHIFVHLCESSYQLSQT